MLCQKWSNMAKSFDMELFLNQYGEQFPPFPELDLQMRGEVIQKCNEALTKNSAEACLNDRSTCLRALACLRTLSRDKAQLTTITSPETVALLIKHAHLSAENGRESRATPEDSQSDILPFDAQLVIESEKVLHNLLIQSPAACAELSSLGCIKALVARLRLVRDNGGHDEKRIPYDLLFFDLRILFLITALFPSTRILLRSDLDAAKVVYDLLNIYLDCGVPLENTQQQSDLAEREVSDRDADLLIEIAKVVYNLTITLERYKPTDEETMIATTLVQAVRRLLLVRAASEEKTSRLRNQAVNLLTGVPRNSYQYLIQKSSKHTARGSGDGSQEPLPANDAEVKRHEQTDLPTKKPTNLLAETTVEQRRTIDFMGYDMNPAVMLIKILQSNLERCTRGSSQLHTQETLVPILTCLCEASRSTRMIRKFLKLEILPPLDRDTLQQRPEIGSAVRNKLCSLMTSPVTEVKLLAAEFLFILCKESVERLVRYTGYGNAAGLLASRGLMAPQKAAEQEARSANNYSDNEDSDTDAYDELREKINPILGCVEDEPRFDPMAGMSEEEKEYEAMKLVDIIDRMARQGIVQPMRIGSDGKPRAVEHVLEMREAVLSAQAGSSSSTAAAASDDDMRKSSTNSDRKKLGPADDDAVDDVE